MLFHKYFFSKKVTKHNTTVMIIDGNGVDRLICNMDIISGKWPWRAPTKNNLWKKRELTEYGALVTERRLLNIMQ